MEPQPLDPNVRRLWLAVALILTGPPAVALVAGIVLLELPALLALLGLLLLGLPAATIPNIAYQRWRYAIRGRDLYTSKGAIRHVETLIPFDRIQFVETRQGPLDRMFGLRQVLIFTAAGRAGRIPGLDHRTSESLRDELSKVAGTTSV